MKYIPAAFSFLFSLFVVAVTVSLVLHWIFPLKETIVAVGIGSDWRNLPGTLLGIWAGVHGWKASIRIAHEKQEKQEAKKARRNALE